MEDWAWIERRGLRPFAVPSADPRGIHPDRWFPADRFLARDPSAEPDRVGDDVRAASLTDRAKAAIKADPREGVRLHLLASELRRENGDIGSAAENYDALTRHYLDAGELRTAVAYMRKLLVAAEKSPERAAHAARMLLAAEVYIAAGRKAAATALIARACAAKTTGDTSTLLRGAELLQAVAAMQDETQAESCGCGSGASFATCCGIGDHEPAEHQVIAIGPAGASADGNASVWWSPGTRGLDLLLDGTSQRTRNWASWRVEDGRHSLVAFPNWSGRALLAARKMRDISHMDPDGTSGPSSAILQATCACEAFVNALAFFVGRIDEGRLQRFDLPPKVQQGKARKYQDKGSVYDRLKQLGERMLGVGWSGQSRLDELMLLINIRNTLVHFHGDENEEVIVPYSDALPDWVQKLPATVVLREPPNPWIDRLLTPSLADWAVDLAEELIGSFRREWAARAELLDIESADETKPPEDIEDCDVDPEEYERRLAELDRRFSPGSVIGHIASRHPTEFDGVEDGTD